MIIYADHTNHDRELLQIVDRLIKLAERRELHRAKIFDQLVEPLFSEFQPVAEDYLRFFRECVQGLEELEDLDDEGEMRKLAKRFRARRDDFLLARSKVQALANVLSRDVHDLSVQALALRILGFFRGSDIHYWSTFMREAVEIFDIVAKGRLRHGFWGRLSSERPVPAHIVRNHIADARFTLEYQWSAISESYAA